MPDESCRKCGGEILVSRCQECKMPLEIICKNCADIICNACYCIKNVSSMLYKRVVTA